MSKSIKKFDAFLDAFDKAFPWSRLIELSLFGLIVCYLDLDQSLSYGLQTLFPMDDQSKVAVLIGMCISFLFSLLYGVLLFIWYCFRLPSTSCKEVPGNE